MHSAICHILWSEIEKCGGKQKNCLLYSSAKIQPCLHYGFCKPSYLLISKDTFSYLKKNNEMEFLPLKRPSNGQNQHQVVFHGQKNQNSNHAKGKTKKNKTNNFQNKKYLILQRTQRWKRQ
jgi:hypothetical protein